MTPSRGSTQSAVRTMPGTDSKGFGAAGAVSSGLPGTGGRRRGRARSRGAGRGSVGANGSGG